MKYDSEDPRLTAYALGELPPEETADMETLLASSPEARQEVEEIRGFADLLTEVMDRETAMKPRPVLDERVTEALAPGSTAAGPSTTDDASTEDGAEILRMPGPASRWRVWAGLGVAAGVCLLAASWWLPPLVRSSDAKRLAARTQKSETPPESRSAVKSIPAEQVGKGWETPMEPTTTDPIPSDTLTALSGPVSEGPVGSPELMKRYGLVPTPAKEAASAAGPTPSAAPIDPLPVAESPTTFAMNPERMKQYGLVAESERQAGRGASPAATVEGMSPDVLMRSRYGLSSGNAGQAAPATRSSLSSALSDRRVLSESGSRDPYYRREQERVDLLVVESRTSEPVSGGGNPGYVDAGDNAFLSPLTQPLSTFGLDVDTGSYANVRRFLNAGTFPPRAAVRVEEMINYFPYRHTEPSGDDVFGVRTDVAMCPWEPKHRLVRIALKARAVTGERPVANLVFLVDVSGSMQPGERLPLLKQALRSLAKRLAPSDRVAIVTYASSAGVRLPSTSAEERDRILEAIDSLESGGSTNGEGGIRQAYEVARRHFIPGGVNRVLLCTDGDFNVGMSDQNELVRLIENEAKSGVFLTTLGVGTDNFKDALMRQLADRGNGSYHFLDSHEEAQRVLLEQRDATFVTVARDAKAQVEFNPGNVAAWRLIGYEKRLMPAQDFNDDTKDAGEVGAGQTVTVLYEVVPVGVQAPGSVDRLKYQPAAAEPATKRVFARTSELLTLKLRYQRPEGSKSVLKEVSVPDREREPDDDFRFAAAVAAFGMALRDPSWDGGKGFDTALRLAQSGIGEDPGGWRSEFLTLVRKARGMRR